MKQMIRTLALLLLPMVCWFTQANVLAQPQPVFLRLKGVGVGSNVAGSATDLQVMGNYAYLTWGGDTNHPGGLEIYSLTNPVVPVRLGGYKSFAPVNAIEVVGQYAYLAEGTAQTSINDPCFLEIIDVSSPANPVRVGGMETLGRANDIRVAGNFAYVAEARRWTGTNLLGALEILDIRTPTNPVRVATFDTAGSATSIDVSGNHVYLADGGTDLQVLDVSDPGHPWLASSYQPDLSRCAFEPLGPPNDFVQLVGNLAYSAGGNGLNVLDISDPSQPVRVLDNGCIPIYGLHVASHYAFVAIYHSSLNTFVLHIADTTHPTNWVTVGWKVDWQPTRMEISSNLIYVATNPLSAYEISDRPAITSLSIEDESLNLTWDFAPGFVLQRTSSLDNPVWSDVANSEGNSSILLPYTGGNEFFRLARP